MACKACGAPSSSGQRFCGECGAPLAAEAGRPERRRDGERRRLTVMFCDLADSTSLAGRLDPEDLREVLRQYQQVCGDTVAAFGGHVARYMGDGVLAYFGFPAAHDDDALRAVRAGLAITEAVEDLSARLREAAQHANVAVRVAIHTGLVVLGDMGAGERIEQADVVGEAPNVAARLQGVAAPQTVVVSETTHRLVRGFFACRSLGPQALKGVARPLIAYTVLSATDAGSRLDVAAAESGLTPLVGRDAELAELLALADEAWGGRSQTVLIQGEAGVGKSRLGRALRERLVGGGHVGHRLQCAELRQSSPLFPVIEHLERWLGLNNQPAEVRREKLRAALVDSHPWPLERVLPLFADLLSVPGVAAAASLSPQRQKRLTLEAWVAWWQAEAARAPVLMCVEDMHWADPSTAEIIELLAASIEGPGLLLVLTGRPEYEIPGSLAASVRRLELARLTIEDTKRLVAEVDTAARLPTRLNREIALRSGGVPLLAEELSRMVLESAGEAAPGDLAAHFDAVPESLYDSLMARLDRLGPAKRVAQVCSTIGRRFRRELAEAIHSEEPHRWQAGLATLQRAGIIEETSDGADSEYSFSHALIRDAAYQSLLRSERRAYHREICRILEQGMAGTAPAQPELLAHHHTEAGHALQASGYWLTAGGLAARRSAYAEAIASLTRALDQIARLPDEAERTRRELETRLILGPCLMATRGFAGSAVSENYSRLREVCQVAEEVPEVVPALYGLWTFALNTGKLRSALGLAETCLDHAKRLGDEGASGQAHVMIAGTLCFLGDWRRSQAHARECERLHDPVRDSHHTALYGVDTLVACLGFDAHGSWNLGLPDTALERGRRCLDLANEVDDQFTIGCAYFMGPVWIHALRRDAQAARELSAEAIQQTAEQELIQWLIMARVVHGWSLAATGDASHGIQELSEGIQALLGAGIKTPLAYLWAVLADAHLMAGEKREALAATDEALKMIEESNERWCEGEVWRLRGEAVLTDDLRLGERLLLRALGICRRQGALGFELRAATSLARCWHETGRDPEAAQLLEEAKSKFTEGFETPDYLDATRLQNEVAHATG